MRPAISAEARAMTGFPTCLFIVTAEVDADIEAAWTRLARAFKDTRTRLHELHREFPQYTFAALDAVVRESASLAPDLSTPPGKRRRGEPVSPELERASARPATPRVPIVHRRVPE
jgi:hypothetical protein